MNTENRNMKETVGADVSAPAVYEKLNMILARINSVPAAVKSQLDGNCAGPAAEQTPEFKDEHFEKEFYSGFPTGPEEEPLFREKFLALINGLDEKSIETAVLSIRRLRALKSSRPGSFPAFTAEERRELEFLREHFYPGILKLEEGCWFYNGYLLPNPHFEPCVFLDRCGAGSLEHPEQLFGKDIIDAGAYIGDSALIFSQMTDGKVWAFEPSAENYAGLLKTIEMNRLTNVVPVQSALGKENGTAEMTKAILKSANSFVGTGSMPYTGTEKAKVVRLDDFVRENNLRVGLIKTDVEGAEQLLLSGAEETIRTQRPALLISIYHNADDYFHIKPMLQNLVPEYHFRIRHPAIGTVMMETMLIAEKSFSAYSVL